MHFKTRQIWLYISVYQYVICMLYYCYENICTYIRVLNHQSDNIALYPFHNPDTSSPFLVYELGFGPSPALPEPWDHRSPCASKTIGRVPRIIRNFRSWIFFPNVKGCEVLDGSLPSLKLKIAPWKWMVGRRSFPFGARPIFRDYVGFREGSQHSFCFFLGFGNDFEMPSPFAALPGLLAIVGSRLNIQESSSTDQK